MFDTPGNILLFSGVVILVVGIILIDHLNRKKGNKKLIIGLSFLFSAIPLNLISQFLYYKIVFSKIDRLRIVYNGSYKNELSFTDYLLTIFQDYFSLTYYSFINTDFNPRWIFVIVNLILIIGFLYFVLIAVNTRNVLSIFKSSLNIFKYLLLIVSLKPFLSYFFYPINVYRRVGPRRLNPETELVGVEPIGYHIENIFEYEPITFVYSFVLILLIYLFIPKKKKNE